jgi:hypothetical protein
MLFKSKISFLFLAFFLTAILFTVCENPVGLGTKVNTEKPVIRNAGDENQPGDFLQGSDNRIWLDVEQEFGIAKVYMEVEYVDKTTGKVERRIVNAYYDETRKQWYVDLDTSDMADGSIKAWVSAIDVSGNITTTTDIIYRIKNTPPQIKLNMPRIEDANFDDDAFLDDLINTDPLYLGFELMGLATDNLGMAEGFPKIMIWPSELPDVDDDGLPSPSDGLYGTWRSLVLPNNYDPTATRFTWPMEILIPDPSAPGGYRLPQGAERKNLPQGKYRFRILTKDLFGNENFYPDRKDNRRGPGGQALAPNDIRKKYIEINYMATDKPVVQVTDYPQYYNGARDFVIKFKVSSGNPMASTHPSEAFLTDNNDGYGTKISATYYPVLVSAPGEKPYLFELTITPEEANLWADKTERIKYISITGKDERGTDGPPTYQHFQYDITPPGLIIDRPVALTKVKAEGNLTGGVYSILYPTEPRPKWVTGVVTVGGNPEDTMSGVKEVWYHIGKPNTGDDDNLSDSVLKTLYENPDFWYDTKLNTGSPVNEPADPRHGKWGGNQYSWTWTYTFPMDYKTLYPDLVQMADALGYSESADPANWNSRRTDGAERVRFYLPFYVKIVDNAENIRVVHYKLCVDPKLDEPTVFITQPSEGNTVGGTVRIAGYAEDNFWMHKVLMRVKKTDGTYEPGANIKGDYYLPTAETNLFYDDYPLYPKPMNPSADIAGWFEVEKIGDSSNVNWFANINADKALNPASGTRNVIVELVALDCAESDPYHNTVNMAGPIEKLNLKFSKDVPIISEVKIIKDGVADRDYKEGIKTTGKFMISMKVDAIGGFEEITVQVTTTSSASAVRLVQADLIQTGNLGGGVWTVTNGTSVGDKYERTITVTVDSAVAGTIPGLNVPGYKYGNTGNFTLEVTATDRTVNKLSSINTFNIGIDNFYPTAEIQTPHIAADNPPDKYYNVLGTAKDYGTGSGSVQGLERVLVYFERARITNTGDERKVEGTTVYISPFTGGVLASSDFENYPNVLDTTTTTGESPNVALWARFPKLSLTTYNSQQVWTSNTALVIDYPENGPTINLDGNTAETLGDKTFGEIWNGPSAEKEWGARVKLQNDNKTKRFDDGPYIVHYLIMDNAGNAAHYQNDIYVENNKPRITSINLGTDINGSGSVTETEPNEYLYTSMAPIPEPGLSALAGVMSPSFRIRGRVFNVKLTVTKGNGAIGASVAYVTAGSSSTPASSMQKGRVYTITAQGSTDFISYGAPNNIPGTAFVATAPGKGTGTVTPYTYTSANRASRPGIGTGEETIIFVGTNFTGIPDSPKNTDGDVNSFNQRLFLVKVWDTTTTANNQGGSPDGEFDQLADVILLKLDIDNTDAKKPSINVAPFGREYITPVGADPANNEAKRQQNISETEYAKNIQMINDVKAGYVQYAYVGETNTIDTNTGTGIANISGRVKFLGRAEDNQRIGSIWVTISNYTSGGNATFRIAQAASNGYLTPVSPGNGEWAFTLLGDGSPRDYLTLEYGHTLNWEFMWDSSKVAGYARENVDITFEVRDAAPTPNINTSTIRVNIVPYISEVETSLSGIYAGAPSVFNRSALGGYPVREGEKIKVKGFNFGSANATISGTALGSSTTTTTAEGNTIEGVVPNVNSGELAVTVSGFASFNNSPNKRKNAAYNQEKNGVNNDKLDNSRYMYVWNTGYLINSGSPSANMTNIANISNPFFRMDNNANRYISYGYYPQQSQGRLRVMKNNTDYDIGTAFSNRMVFTTVSVGGINGSFYAAGSDLSSSRTDNRGLQLGMSNPAGDNNIISNGLNNSNGSIRLVNTASSNPERFRIPRIAVQPTNGTTNRDNDFADRILISYYDSKYDVVRVIYGNVGTTLTTTHNTTSTNANITANLNYDNPNGNIIWVEPINTTADTEVHSTSSVQVSDATRRGSEFTAVGFLSNGVPLVAWYDNVNTCLVFSYGFNNSSTTPLSSSLTTGYGSAGSRVNTTNWQRTQMLDETGKGTHVDMAVDGDDNVHLAYYSSDGGLWYTFIPKADGSSGTNLRPDISRRTTVRVDTFLSAGTKLMINVREESSIEGTRYVPYISYAHASYPGTKASIRVAWRTDFSSTEPKHGTNTVDRFEGTWEVMTVPVSDGVIPNTDEFVCNGVPTKFGATWTAPTGSNLTYNSNLEQTIVLGYMTNRWYEGAILKGDIRDVPTILKK